jgi:hypothetical protein
MGARMTAKSNETTTHEPGARGRHRLSRAADNGEVHRPELPEDRPRGRARHRLAKPRKITAAGISVAVATATAVAIAVSGWYAASGASAVVQMLAR